MNQAPTKRIIPLFSSGKLDSSILQMDLINKSLQNFKSAGLMNQAPTKDEKLAVAGIILNKEGLSYLVLNLFLS